MDAGKVARWGAGAAAALAGAAWFNARSARKAEEEHPPTGRFVDVDGVQVHYVERGRSEGSLGSHDAPTIVLIHGNGSLVEDFLCSGIVEPLAARHRVLIFDRPGYGYTERPDDREWSAEAQAKLLARAAAQLGAVRPVVVGHSYGALVALAWGLDHPAAALVLASGYYYPTPRLDAVGLKLAEVPAVGKVFTHAWAPMQGRLVGPLGLKMIFAPDDVPQHFRDAMPFGLMLRPGQVRAQALDGARMPADASRLSARIAGLRLSLTIIWGDGDKLVGQDGQSRRLAESVPGATVLTLADAGHMVHQSRPEAVAQAIIRQANAPAA